MAPGSDFKILKEKKLDRGTTLKITKNAMSGRIFVEFTCKEPKIVLQKNFDNSLHGRKESEEFSKSIKNTKQLLEYFGLRDNE